MSPWLVVLVALVLGTALGLGGVALLVGAMLVLRTLGYA